MSVAREAALKAFCRVEEQKAYSNLAIDGLFSEYSLSKQDIEFATSLFYGTLERKLTLDFAIRQYSGRSIDKIQPMVRHILRLGFYQILFSRVDSFAAVNESVNLCKRFRVSRASGFVNALLRSLIRNDKKIDYPNKEKDLALYLSVVYSCPKWLVKSFLKDYGENSTQHLLEDHLNKPPIYLRTNPLKGSQDEIKTILEDEGLIVCDTPVKNCLLLKNGNPVATDAFKNGFYHVQDISSQLASAAIASYKPNTVLDLCAAPGGKSFTIAEEIEGNILSCDLTKSRLSLIQKGKKRLGLNNITTICNDAASSLPKGEFDLVLCDVPCSGFGTIRRKPEIKYKEKESLFGLLEIQQQIALNAVKAVKPGGYLVYSTCTLRKEENEDVIFWLQKQVPTLIPQKLPDILHKFFPTDNNYATFLPDKISCDGFFFSVFKKEAI